MNCCLRRLEASEVGMGAAGTIPPSEMTNFKTVKAKKRSVYGPAKRPTKVLEDNIINSLSRNNLIMANGEDILGHIITGHEEGSEASNGDDSVKPSDQVKTSPQVRSMECSWLCNSTRCRHRLLLCFRIALSFPLFVHP